MRASFPVEAVPPAHRLAAELVKWLEDLPGTSVVDDHEPGPFEQVLATEARFQQLLWDQGWTRAGWPQRCGGLGGTAVHRAAVYDTLWQARSVVPIGLQSVEVLAPILTVHSPQLAEAHIPPYVRGDYHICQAFSEPEAGSDLGAVATKAVACDDGFRLTGHKTWSSLASYSKHSVVLVRTGDPNGGYRGLSMVLVDLEADGVTVQPIRAATGRDEFAEIFLDDVFVPRSQLIGDEGRGWSIAMEMLEWERGMYAWQRQGFMLRRLADISHFAQAGQQSEQVLGAAYLSIHALRARSLETVRRLAAGEHPGPEISVDKILLAGAEQQVFEAARVLAPAAYLWDVGAVGEMLRSEWFYSRAASVYGGAGEIQRDILAERVLGMPREVRRGG